MGRGAVGGDRGGSAAVIGGRCAWNEDHATFAGRGLGMMRGKGAFPRWYKRVISPKPDAEDYYSGKLMKKNLCFA